MPDNKIPQLALFILLGVVGVATAQTPATSAREPVPQVGSRQPAARQGRTPGEATRLGRQTPARSATSRTARADGVMTPEERHDLRHTAHPSRRAVNRHRQDGRERD